MEHSRKTPADVVEHLGILSHDLSNSLETILQAAYLLQQAKLETAHKKWAQMIDTAARDAAHTNREIRKVLQAQSSVGPRSSSRADAKSDN
jgi:light-regulated signal transduction histidine kinase (bacteriophytochrome)